MEVLVRWDDGVQNIVPSTDLRKFKQTNKNWKRTRFTQKFKEGDRIKMWFDDKWLFGIILFVDRAHILSDNPSVLPPETPVMSGNTPETLINKDDSIEEAPGFNDYTNGSGNLNIEDPSVEEESVFNDDSNGSGNFNIVLSEPFTLEGSFNFTEKDCEESNENNSLEGDKTLNEVKIETEDKNISPIKTRRKQYVPVKLSTRKTYNSYKSKVKTKTIPPGNIQATSKTKIPADLVLKPCSVVVDDSVAKGLRVSDTYSVCQGGLGGVGSALAEAESVAKPVLTKQTEKNPFVRSTTTVTRASLRQSNQKSELVQLGPRRNASKQKQASATKKPSHLSIKGLNIDFFEQNLLKLFNKNDQSTILLKKEKVEIIKNIPDEPYSPPSDGGEFRGFLTEVESHIKNNTGIKNTPDQETKLTETRKDLPKKTCTKNTEQAIEFCDEIPAKKMRKALTTVEDLNQNLSILDCSEQSNTPTKNENNFLRIPPSLEVILEDSSDVGKMSTTRTGSSINENNKSGETQPISVQVYINDPKTKSVISEADLAGILHNAKPNVKSDSLNSPKNKLEFTRSLVPFLPPAKYSETVFSSMQTKQLNLDTLNKNKLVDPSTKPHGMEILCKTLTTSNSSKRSRPTAKSVNSQSNINSPHSPQPSDSEMTKNDLINSLEVTDIARKSIDKSAESQEEKNSDSVLTLEELLKSGDAVSLDHKYNELKDRLSSPALLPSSLRTKKIIHPPKPAWMNNSTNRKTSNQLIENKKMINFLQTSNNSSHLDKPSQITGSENGLKEVGKPAEPDLEECLDGVPPFIQDVFECGNIRNGFNASDLVFVLSLLPDIEEMTDSQKIKFQVKVIEMINDVMNDPHLTYC